MPASARTASWTVPFVVTPRSAERPFWSNVVRPGPGDVFGFFVMAGSTALLLPLALETAPLGLLLAVAPSALLAAMLAQNGRDHGRRLRASRATLAVDADGIHERSGSIVFTTPPSQVTRAWRRGSAAYVRIARLGGTIALDLTTLEEPERDDLVQVLRSGRAAEDPAGTVVADWTTSEAEERRAGEAVSGVPAGFDRTVGLEAITLALLVTLLTVAPDESRPVLVLALFVVGPLAITRLAQLCVRDWRWATRSPTTVTITPEGVVEREDGGRRVVTIPWSAVARCSIQDDEVLLVTDPTGALLVPPRAATDEQRVALRAAVELHRPEALSGE